MNIMNTIGKNMLKILKMSSLLGQSQLYIYNILYILYIYI